MWTEDMRKIVSRMAEADKTGKLMEALVDEEAPAGSKMWHGSILTKSHADALGNAARGVRLTSPTHFVKATCRPRPPRKGDGSTCHRLSMTFLAPFQSGHSRAACTDGYLVQEGKTGEPYVAARNISNAFYRQMAHLDENTKKCASAEARDTSCVSLCTCRRAHRRKRRRR